MSVGEQQYGADRGDRSQEQVVEALVESERPRVCCLGLRGAEDGAAPRGRPPERLEHEDVAVNGHGDERDEGCDEKHRYPIIV